MEHADSQTPVSDSYLRPRWRFADVEEGELRIGKMPLTYLATRFGTPFYLVVESEVRDRLRRFKNAFPYPRFNPQFAVKCNSNFEILRIVHEEGFEVDASSVGEIILALMAGFEPEQISLTTVFKSEQDMIFAAQIGVKAMSVDSLEELDKAIRVAKVSGSKLNLFMRVNPKVSYGDYSTTQHHYGIPIDDAKHAIDLAASAPEVDIVGLHWHGAYVPGPEVYHLAMRKLLPLAKYAKEKGHPIRYLDLGGGFPISSDNTSFTPEDLGPGLVSELESLQESLGLDLILVFEPGKFIVANSGIGVTQVACVKDFGHRKLAVVDASTYHMLPDPLVCECYYPILPATKMDSPPDHTYDISGCTCDCIDKLGKQRQLPSLREGDLLAVMDCGAYSNVLASNFNTLRRPKMVLLKEDGTLKLIRRQDRYSELFAAELDMIKLENDVQLKNIWNKIRASASRVKPVGKFSKPICLD